MQSSAILCRSDKATCEVVADEAIVIHLEKGTFYSLNRLGTEFWERLDGAQTINEHARSLADRYDVNWRRVEADLLELSSRLLDEALVQQVRPSGDV